MINADRLMNHFNLTQLPFGRAVSEAGLLAHHSFSEAMARLSLALATKTPALFTAEPGLGKSTLLGCLADSLFLGQRRGIQNLQPRLGGRGNRRALYQWNGGRDGQRAHRDDGGVEFFGQPGAGGQHGDLGRGGERERGDAHGQRGLL